MCLWLALPNGRENIAKINHHGTTLLRDCGGRRHFTICFDVVVQAHVREEAATASRDSQMSELTRQPFFLKDLHQPFFLKESPSIVADEPPIDVGHLGRMSCGERNLEFQVLELFDRQADMLLDRMREVDPAAVAGLAQTLSGSAREIGAWRVAKAAEALERVVMDAGALTPALEALDCAVIEARLAICAMQRISALASGATNKAS
jgi:hypothetical protein